MKNNKPKIFNEAEVMKYLIKLYEYQENIKIKYRIVKAEEN